MLATRDNKRQTPVRETEHIYCAKDVMKRDTGEFSVRSRDMNRLMGSVWRTALRKQPVARPSPLELHLPLTQKTIPRKYKVWIHFWHPLKHPFPFTQTDVRKNATFSIYSTRLPEQVACSTGIYSIPNFAGRTKSHPPILFVSLPMALSIEVPLSVKN